MINIFIVEDHHIVRYGVKKMLETNPMYNIIGESDCAEALLDDIKQLKIDLVITDISLKGINGIDLTRKIKDSFGQQIKVLVLSMHADDLYIIESFNAGANGYLLKDFKEEEMLHAINTIMNGELYTSTSVANIVTDNFFKREHLASLIPKVSKREKEIIRYISLGMNNREIAETLALSASTIDTHRYNVLKKLEAKNTAELIIKAVKLKIITLVN